MVYGLFIQDSPGAEAGFDSAARFLGALLQRGHSVRQIFLYSDAVLAVTQPLHSGLRGLDALLDLALPNKVPVLACQSAIERLGLSIKAGSGVSRGSLGQWFDANYEMDRIMSFGG